MVVSGRGAANGFKNRTDEQITSIKETLAIRNYKYVNNRKNKIQQIDKDLLTI